MIVQCVAHNAVEISTVRQDSSWCQTEATGDAYNVLRGICKYQEKRQKVILICYSFMKPVKDICYSLPPF